MSAAFGQSDWKEVTNTHTPPDFDERVLTGIKGIVNPENKLLFESWRRAEGGNAKWNPLNSTLLISGFTLSPDYNSIHVRNYAFEFVGIGATIITFASRNDDGTMKFGGIVSDLQKGVKTANQIASDRRIQFSTWGTDVDLLLEVIDDIRAGR